MPKATGRETAAYQQMIQANKPKRPLGENLLWAFLVGGFICLVGQGVKSIIMTTEGLTAAEAGPPTVGVMIFLGALLTGLGIYDRLARFAGMGAALPITGFANAIVAPAMEFRREGLVLGVSARMFSVAGPVIVHAVVVAVIVGTISYYLGR